MAKRPRPYKQMPFCPRETFFWTLPLLFVALDKYNFGMHVTLKTTWKLLWKEKVSGGGFMQHKVILMMQAYKMEPLFPLQKISHVTFWSKVSILGVVALSPYLSALDFCNSPVWNRQKVKFKNQVQKSISWTTDFKNQMQMDRKTETKKLIYYDVSRFRDCSKK